MAQESGDDKDKNKEAKEEVKLKPDLWVTEIIAPNGLVQGATNQVKVIVENRSKDTKIEGKVKLELVVIQNESSDRMSYFSEVDGMGFRQKRETVFSNVDVKNGEFVRFLAILDPDKVVDEENEENNRKLYKVWVKKPESEAKPDADADAEPEADAEGKPASDVESAPDSEVEPKPNDQ